MIRYGMYRHGIFVLSLFPHYLVYTQSAVMTRRFAELIFILFSIFSISVGFRSTRIRVRKPRVPEGKIAERDQFPYHATLVDSTTFHTYFCGAAILNGQTVLTAAWCVYNRSTENVNVAYGEIILKPRDDVIGAGKIMCVVDNDM